MSLEVYVFVFFVFVCLFVFTEGAKFFSLVKNLAKSYVHNSKLNFLWVDPEPFPTVSTNSSMSTHQVILIFWTFILCELSTALNTGFLVDDIRPKLLQSSVKMRDKPPGLNSVAIYLILKSINFA